jgi:hypothetical protein
MSDLDESLETFSDSRYPPLKDAPEHSLKSRTVAIPFAVTALFRIYGVAREAEIINPFWTKLAVLLRPDFQNWFSPESIFVSGGAILESKMVLESY